MNKWIANYITRSIPFRNVKLRNDFLEDENRRLKRENAELAERASAIAEKLTTVRVQKSPEPIHRIRVCVDVDTQLVQQGLMHGNDNLFIEYVGRSIGCRAADAIRTCNFHRWER